MKKPIILAIGGAVAGIAVAFVAFTMFLGGGSPPAAAAEAPLEPVHVAGKLGPRITLADRVFNLLTGPGESPVYLKLQTIIEFETTDQRWERVLTGCGAHEPHGAVLDAATEMYVSAAPAGIVPAPVPIGPEAGGGEAGDPCEAEQAALLAEFEHQIGSGVALIEDAVTTIVTGHTAAEIATPAGKDALKAEIAAAVEELIEEPHVSRVLFLNFITQ
jgi:flagellar basal body-associated protein FliL